ncbi:ATP-binding protein [Roseateles sp. BYS180W]|uniref:histidine kinase n=1 Tax=Roseateles rivi TaxID=3299028 RepID=A0ABW7FRJ8_9BURK
MSSASSSQMPATAQGRAELLAGRQNLLQLVQLRWLAVMGQLATVLGVPPTMGIALPLRDMLSLLAVLALFNVASWLRAVYAERVPSAELFAGLLVDVSVLAGLLHLAGGITNPFIFLFLLQLTVGAVLLPPRYGWALVGYCGVCFALLALWFRPLVLPGLGVVRLPVHYVVGLLLCFVLSAGLVVLFIQRISTNLRQRDAHLADLRQRAAEEEHIVRMGLLASGAAHELGTPLATLSVILGDWSRMGPFAADPELREEIEEMQRQIERCKGIVSGILRSAGEVRGESPTHSTLGEFLDELVDDWRQRRAHGQLQLQLKDVPDIPIVSDAAITQMMGNILDNALEAAPGQPIVLQAACEGDWLNLVVHDQGPGFAKDMLNRVGKPYQSTKDKHGRGLGLFLALNVARSLGGQLGIRNRQQGGADVMVRLPLAALQLRDNVHHGYPR